MFDAFLTAQSTVGLFFILALSALIVGLQITLVRWLFFEKWFARQPGLKSSEFAALKDDKVLTAFRAAVDEHYRYHQFWGGLAVVIPLIVITVIKESSCSISTAIAVVALLAMEILTCIAANEANQRYITRARAILEG